MSDDRWERIVSICQDLLDLPECERSSRLDAACAGDATLRAEIEALLVCDARADSFLEPPRPWAADDLLGSLREPPLLGRRLGSYTIQSVLGRGGMGVVYEAEQESPRRIVALKVMRALPYLDEVAPRLFRREGQALARLAHPGIAAIYEAGRSDDGWFYLAMERVDGVALTRYASENRLSLRDRLELFRRVCGAVHYAHQRGVIHRDLKPANILVTSQPIDVGRAEERERRVGQPKILDFGVARITEPHGDDPSITHTGAFHGTIAYASPEQTSGRNDEIHAPSDVYSLGVILYELLTERLPHDVHGLPLPEAARLIREQSPPPPGSLVRALRGDVDTIVLRALQKEPADRYPSAAALAEDIERHLADEPILARPPSLAYGVRKFVKRHALVSALAAGLLLVLLAGGATTTLLTFRFARERDLARAAQSSERDARRSSDEVASFLERLFEQADPEQQATSDPKLRDLIAAGEERLKTDLDAEPLVRARLAAVIGEVYRKLADYPRSRSLLESAVDIVRRERGNDDPDLISPLGRLADTLTAMGDHDGAQQVRLEILRICQHAYASPDDRIADAYEGLGAARYYAGDYEAAVRYHRQCLEVSRALHGEVDPMVSRSLHNLGAALLRMRKLDEAQQVLEEALAQRRTEGSEEAGLTCEMLAQVEFGRKDFAAAEQYAREQVEAMRTAHHDRHPAIAEALNNLAFVVTYRSGPAAGEPIYREALEIRRAAFSDVHPSVADTLSDLAGVRSDQNDLAEAAALNEEALRIRRLTFPRGHDRIAGSAHGLGETLRRLGRMEEAEPLLLESRDIFEHNHGEGYRLLTPVLVSLASLYRAQSRTEPLLDTLERLGRNLIALQQRGDALAVLGEALQLAERLHGANDPRTATVRALLVKAQGRDS